MSEKIAVVDIVPEAGKIIPHVEKKDTIVLTDPKYYLGNVREDAVKYGLLIQDLVELTLQSSNDPIFRLYGKITKSHPGGFEIVGCLKGNINDYIVCPVPIPEDFRTMKSRDQPSPEDRLGRRVLPLEHEDLNGFIHWWRRENPSDSEYL